MRDTRHVVSARVSCTWAHLMQLGAEIFGSRKNRRLLNTPIATLAKCRRLASRSLLFSYYCYTAIVKIYSYSKIRDKIKDRKHRNYFLLLCNHIFKYQKNYLSNLTVYIL